MTTQYRATSWAPYIERCEVEKVSESFVWIAGKKRSRTSLHRGFFDTWQQAHNWLTTKFQLEIDAVRLQLNAARGKLGNVTGLRPAESENDGIRR